VGFCVKIESKNRLYPPESVTRIFKVLSYGIEKSDKADIKPTEYEVLSASWQKEVANILDCEPGNVMVRCLFMV
jgi:hypothetical protein